MAVRTESNRILTFDQLLTNSISKSTPAFKDLLAVIFLKDDHSPALLDTTLEYQVSAHIKYTHENLRDQMIFTLNY